MSKYLALFVSESVEHLEALGRELVAQEQGGGSVDSMFRHAHSVKGMAASMGFDGIALAAHRMEDLVDEVRAGRRSMDGAVVDVMLAVTDALLVEVKVAGESGPPGDLTEPLAALESLLRAAPVASGSGGAAALSSLAAPSDAPGEPGTSAPEVPSGPVPVEGRGEAAESDGASGAGPLHGAPAGVGERGEGGAAACWSLDLRVSEGCRTPGVRAFLAYKKLGGLGEVVSVRPPLDDLKAGHIPNGRISIELVTERDEAQLKKSAGAIPDIELIGLVRQERGGASEVPGAAAADPTPLPLREKGQQPEGELQGAPKAADPTAAGVSAGGAPKVVGAESTSRTLKVRAELLDYFLDNVGELLLATAGIRELGKALPEAVRTPLDEGVYRLHALVKDLHNKVMSIRMTPLSVITERLPRAVRDLARKRGREVELLVSGSEIELDRAIIDGLADPVLHLVRNCVDHGIEPPEERRAAGKPEKGILRVDVSRDRDRVVLTVADDGRGMNAERLRRKAVERGLLTERAAATLDRRAALLLSCLPGLSTAAEISDVSGRGVGMDAVKQVVEDFGGTLEIDSEAGLGTRFTLRLPLTVAVVQLLLVSVGDEILGLPIAKVLQVIEAPPSALSRSNGVWFLSNPGGLLPVRELSRLLELPGGMAPLDGPVAAAKASGSGTDGADAPEGALRPYVVMEGLEGRVALAAERLLGQEEVVLKALVPPLDSVIGLAGVTILGNGRPIFILDVPRLLTA